MSAQRSAHESGGHEPPSSVEPHPDTELLMDWADGELEETEAEPILAHLGECDECRAFVRELSALPESLTLVPPNVQLLVDQARLAAAPSEPESPAAQPAPRSPIPIRPRRSSRLFAGIGSAMAAAASVLFFVIPRTPIVAQGYRAVLLGGLVQLKSSEPSQTFEPSSLFKVRATPKEAMDVEVFGQVVAVAPDQTIRRLEPSSKSPTGVITFETEAINLFGEETGHWSVYVLVSADADKLRAWHPDPSKNGARAGPVVEMFEVEYVGSVE